MSFLTDLLAAVQAWLAEDSVVHVGRVVLSAVLVYVAALWIVRTGKKRFLGRSSVFDFLLALILGSTLARAINGGAPLVATVAAGFALIAMHYVIGMAAHRSSRFGHLVKGGSDIIYRDGHFETETMRRHHLTRHDLEEATRMAGLADLGDVAQAGFERSGRISVVPRRRLETLEVQVEEGVQTVRVEILV